MAIADADPTRRAPFQAGDWRADPARGEIVRDGQAVRLEPRSMQLLRLLAETPDHTFTRDEIIDRLWDGRAVTDDAVGRQIAKLRAALGDDARAPRYLQTLPKLGVRWIAGSPQAPLQPAGRRWRAIATAAAMILAAGVALWVMRPAPKPVAAFAVRPFTALAGYEIDPALSPSGDLAAYAARAPGESGYGLYVRSLAGGEARRITAGELSARKPAWSPAADRIAFVGHGTHGCFVGLVSPFGGAPRRIAPCLAAADGGLAWRDNNTLVIADRDGPAMPFRLFSLDLRTGARATLTTPPPASDGDTDPVMADGRLLFTRSPTLGVEDIHERLADGAVRRRSSDRTKIHGLSAIDGGRALLVASNRLTGVFAIWRFDLKDGSWRQLAATGSGDTPGASPASPRFLFERWNEQVALWTLPQAGGDGARLTPVQAYEWSPALSPDGTRLAYVSDRDGSADLWLAAADGSGARRLTDYGGAYVQDPAWSPDGRTLAAALPAGDQYDLVLIDLETGAQRRIGGATDERHPAFTADGRALLFARRGAGGWSLVERALAGGRERVLASDALRAVEAADGSAIWFTRPFVPGLWRLDRAGGAITRMAAWPTVVDARNWAVDGDTVWMFVRDLDPGRPRLARLGAEGRLVVARELEGAHHRSGLSVRGGRVWFARSERSEADLMMAEPAPERR